MHAFFCVPGTDETARLLPDEARHAQKVLRLRPGDELIALDGRGGRWRGRMLSGDEIELLEALPDGEPRASVTLYQGVPKAEKLEMIVQKATELGAARIRPVIMARSVARAEGGEKRLERLERIAREAVKQCGRACIPRVCAPTPLPAVLDEIAACDAALVPWETARGVNVRAALESAHGSVRVAIVIGPEGGIAPEEISALERAGAKAVTLGPRILRTETAALAALTQVMTALGEMGD